MFLMSSGLLMALLIVGCAAQQTTQETINADQRPAMQPWNQNGSRPQMNATKLPRDLNSTPKEQDALRDDRLAQAQTACADKQAGEACTMTTPQGEQAATCTNTAQGLTCGDIQQSPME